MICEIINPSDAYTLITDDFVMAGIAIAVLGNGQMGLKNIDGEESTPVLFGWDEWLKDHGIPELSVYINENSIKMAGILDTVLIGSKSDRKLVDETLAMLDKDKHEEWLENWHDKKRSSMNDIGKAAKNLATRLREISLPEEKK